MLLLRGKLSFYDECQSSSQCLRFSRLVPSLAIKRGTLHGRWIRVSLRPSRWGWESLLLALFESLYIDDPRHLPHATFGPSSSPFDGHLLFATLSSGSFLKICLVTSPSLHSIIVPLRSTIHTTEPTGSDVYPTATGSFIQSTNSVASTATGGNARSINEVSPATATGFINSEWPTSFASHFRPASLSYRLPLLI